MSQTDSTAGRRLPNGPAATLAGFEVGSGEILDLIRSGTASTRSRIADVTGLSRSTVTQRLQPLFDSGLLLESEETLKSGGRPAKALRLNRTAGAVLCLDVGEQRTRIALADLGAHVLTQRVERLSNDAGPEAMLNRIVASVHEMVTASETPPPPIVGIGLGLPAPVDFLAGRAVGWSVISGWDGYDIRSHLHQHFQVPILIDNDVNLLTLAEHRRHWRDEAHLFYVKAGTGIGSGLILDKKIHRGAQGAAGDIGHTHIRGYGDPLCRCGNFGCLEALAGGWALARDLGLSRRVDATHGARDVARWVKRGDSDAVASLRASGRVLGEAVAHGTSLLNPGVIVIGGILATAGDHLIAGVRELVYQHALPLATRQLRIVPTAIPSGGGIIGAGHLVLDEILRPTAVTPTMAAMHR